MDSLLLDGMPRQVDTLNKHDESSVVNINNLNRLKQCVGGSHTLQWNFAYFPMVHAIPGSWDIGDHTITR